MPGTEIYRFKTISELHHFRELPKPQHPLISVVNVELIKHLNINEPTNLVLDFYCIALKRNFNAKMKYGQQQYDFDEGLMTFVSPGQVFSIEHNKSEGEELKHSGWMLYIHPDFLWNTPLARKITQYAFFDYSVNEALFLSEKEELIIKNLIQNISSEYHSNIDQFSQNVIIAQIDLLLTYAERFYQRQFITRKITNHSILNRFEDILTAYFKSDLITKKGLPTVAYMAGALNVSPNYLSGLLKVLTGQSSQQHIHDKLIEQAKEKLSTTGLSVSEIAYGLGFEHPQSFSKLFKTKTKVSPLEFRQSFN